jgi:hypothetical protein
LERTKVKEVRKEEGAKDNGTLLISNLRRWKCRWFFEIELMLLRN